LAELYVGDKIYSDARGQRSSIRSCGMVKVTYHGQEHSAVVLGGSHITPERHHGFHRKEEKGFSL
jgi:hypothetical protein